MPTGLLGEKVPMPSIATVASERLADAVQSFVLAAPKEFDPSLLSHQATTIWS